MTSDLDHIKMLYHQHDKEEFRKNKALDMGVYEFDPEDQRFGSGVAVGMGIAVLIFLGALFLISYAV